MKCPHCGKEINVGALMGSVSTPAKARAARQNAKLGGWPKGKPRNPKRKLRRSNNASARRDNVRDERESAVYADIAKEARNAIAQAKGPA